MEYDNWQSVGGKKFQARISHWYAAEGPEAGEHWYILLEDRHLTPTNYDKLDPQMQIMIRAMHPRNVSYREDPETGMSERIIVGDLPKKQRVTHDAWPRGIARDGHKGPLSGGDVQSIMAWLDEHGAGELKSRAQRTIRRMQKRFERYLERSGR